MSENDQFEVKDSAELAKWRRKKARMEDDFEGANQNLKDYLKSAFGKGVSETRLNLARELKKSETEKPLVTDSFGFRQTHEGEITGMETDFPWKRDVE